MLDFFSMSKLIKGEAGFDLFYHEMFQGRWPDLKKALLEPKKHLAVFNPFSSYHPSFQSTSSQISSCEGSSFISGISFDHQVGHLSPEKNTEGFFNYYLMDAASLLPVEALDIGPGDHVIDLCAAPGGKSLLCAFKLKGTGKLISNDRSASRRARIHRIFNDYLPPSLQKNLSVTSHDASKWGLYEKSVFDKVLLDAPCSSERHVLENAKELSRWSPGRSKALATLQFAMLASALDIVKPNGLIVYSTCSLSRWENDEVIRKLYKKRSGLFEIIKREFPFGESTEFGHRVLPDKTQWGPFYLAIIRKLPS